jgi:hypothetical protein
VYLSLGVLLYSETFKLPRARLHDEVDAAPNFATRSLIELGQAAIQV